MKRSYICISAAIIAVAQPAMAWDYKVVTDDLTDEKRGIASVADKDAEGLLVVKCDEPGRGSLYVDIISVNYLGDDFRGYRRDMEFRFDSDQPDKMLASYSDRSALLLDTGPKSKGGKFVARLRDSSRLVVRVFSYRHEQYTMTFDTTGAREVIARVAEVCGDSNWLADD